MVDTVPLHRTAPTAMPLGEPFSSAHKGPWLSSYPAGVPWKIDPGGLRSLSDLIHHCTSHYADRVAYVQMGTRLTYGQLDVYSRAFAVWLQASGFRKGDRLAIMLPNLLQFPIALFGAVRAGLVVVTINPMYTAHELQHQLMDSGAAAILVLENFAHTLQRVLHQTAVKRILVTAVGDFLSFPKSTIVNYVNRHRWKQVPDWDIPGALDFRHALPTAGRRPLLPVDLGPDDLALLQYTGGTTGVPKGAMLTHGNLCANVLQSQAWVAGVLDTPGVLVTPLPLYHIFGLEGACLLFAWLGWTNVLIVNPRDLSGLVRELKRYPFAFLSGVNTLFQGLLNTPDFDTVDFSHLRVTLAGGMAVQTSVAQRWHEVTGVPITQAWGLTETSPGACINPPGIDFNGSVGLPIPSTEIAIKDESGQDLAIEQIGEICVRGPQVMRGYWNRPRETAQVTLPDGWLRSGDIGRMDCNGFVYLTDRKKDIIVVSGFKVFPNEVEAVVMGHPGVLEAAAIALPDMHSGEVVALCAVRRDPALTERALTEHCRSRLAPYKVPKHIYFRNDLPKTIVGKISKKALRDELASGASEYQHETITTQESKG